MDLVIYIIALMIAGAYITKRTLYHMHMYQLNSYRIERYWRFIKQNRKRLLSPALIIFYLVILVTSGLYSIIIDFRLDALWIVWSVFVLLRVFRLFRSKEKVKKPLVYTMRVKRLLLVIGVLNVAVIAILPQSMAALHGLTLLMVTVPLIMLLANLLLKPVELYLKNYYYNDAKQILEGHKDLIKIGITGSYGKTSTKFILETILSQKYTTLVTPHSYNTTLGVVITVRKSLNRSVEVFVAEMGAKQKGDIKEICDLVQPDYGMVTAVGPQHLETMGSLSNIIDTKFEMMQAVASPGKKGFVNGDSSNIRTGMERYPDVNYVSYGSDSKNRVRIENVESTVHGSKFDIVSDRGRHEYETRLLGMHNILNIAGAIGIAMELDMTYEQILTGVKEIKSIPHRLELKMQGDYYILDDAFNSNPTGARFALEVLDQFESGKKIIMTPGMIELGEMDMEVHYEFGKQIAGVCNHVVLIGENKTKDIYRGLEDSDYPMDKVVVKKTVYEGFAYLRNIVSQGDVVLIENDLPDNFNE